MNFDNYLNNQKLYLRILYFNRINHSLFILDLIYYNVYYLLSILSY